MARRTAADPRLGTTVADYRIVALAGRGGMSVVYRARDERLGRDIALKLLAPELTDDDQFRRRFLRESQVAASLHHPSIVPVYSAGEADGLLYLAMRYIEGADLKALLRREGTLEPARALALLGQVAAALDAAHRHGLVHRDVKPANILLEGAPPDENGFLADFGLTKTDASRAATTTTGQLVGTLDYVAPEQIRGQKLDGCADVYSLACVLYESLAGSPPFTRGSEVAVLYAHLQDAPLPASQRHPGLPPAIDAVLSRALAKQPGERHASAGELVADASQALAVPAEPLPRRQRWLGRGRITRPVVLPPGRLLTAVVALLASTGLALLAYGAHLSAPGSGWDVLGGAELGSIDRRFAIRGKEQPPRNIVVVKIDDTTFNDLGEPWPFRRSLHARVIRNLKADGAQVIAYDIQFSEPTPGRRGIIQDNEFMDASHAAGNLVFSTTELNDKGQGPFLGGQQGLGYARARLGNGNFDPDPGGVIRRTPYELQGLKAFSVATVERATGKTVRPFSGDRKLIDFVGPVGTIPSIPFSRVYSGKFPRGYFRDKIVVVGAGVRAGVLGTVPTGAPRFSPLLYRSLQDPSLQDFHPVSFGQDEMPGPEIQANAIATVLRDLPLALVPTWINLVLIIVLGIVGMLAASRLKWSQALVVSLGVAAIYLVVAQVAFDAGMVLPVTYPLFALAAVTFFVGLTRLSNAHL